MSSSYNPPCYWRPAAGDNCLGLTSNGSFLVDNCRLDGFYKATLLYHRQELGLDHVNRFFIMERVTVLMKLTGKKRFLPVIRFSTDKSIQNE